jgi:predicted Zn finger-like uncharacterized protein
VVVQCPTCQSKFRIADDKVTDRGVRVRCTSCKNVFQVKKPGATGGDAQPGPGTTIDLSTLGAAAVAKSGTTGKVGAAARPSTGPVKPSTGPVKPTTGPVKPSTGPVKPSTGPVKPSTGPVRPGASRSGPSDQRLDADDLFGMAELTGDAPLSGGLDASPPPPPSVAKPGAAPAPAPAPRLEDLDFELDDLPAPKAHNPPSPPLESVAAAQGPLDPLEPPPPAAPAAAVADGSVALLLDDPFATPLSEAGSLATDAPAPDDTLAKAADARPKSDRVPRAPPPLPPEAEIAPAWALISSALTGLLGAALAVIVVIVSTLSDDTAPGWLGFGPAAEVIATGVVSGLYDTAGGKPVFYVRGRVENRTGKVRGPVRVTAELVADGTAEAKAEAIAGAEPTPEDVWSVRSPADAERLSRTLQSARVQRKLEPGASLPFFALMSEPPADLQRHRLQVRVETVDAWTPPAAKAARDK